MRSNIAIGRMNSAFTIAEVLANHGGDFELAKNLRPRCDNPLLAEPLYQTGHIERMGTGLEDLFAACKSVGLPRPKLEVSAHEVHLTIFRTLPNKLPDKLPNKLPNKFPNKLPNKTKSNVLTEGQRRLIQFLSKDAGASARMLAQHIGVSSRTIRTQIAILKKLGVLRRVGSNKTGYWLIMEGYEP